MYLLDVKHQRRVFKFAPLPLQNRHCIIASEGNVLTSLPCVCLRKCRHPMTELPFPPIFHININMSCMSPKPNLSPISAHHHETHRHQVEDGQIQKANLQIVPCDCKTQEESERHVLQSTKMRSTKPCFSEKVSWNECGLVNKTCASQIKGQQLTGLLQIIPQARNIPLSSNSIRSAEAYIQK